MGPRLVPDELEGDEDPSGWWPTTTLLAWAFKRWALQTRRISKVFSILGSLSGRMDATPDQCSSGNRTLYPTESRMENPKAALGSSCQAGVFVFTRRV